MSSDNLEHRNRTGAAAFGHEQVRAIRRRGAQLGGAPGLVFAVVLTFAYGTFALTDTSTLVGLIAIGVGMLLGWWHAPAVRAAPRWPVLRLLLIASEAVVLGLLAVAVLDGWLTSAAHGLDDFTMVASSLMLLGLWLFGPPMLLVTLLSANAWAWLLRREALPTPGRGLQTLTGQSK